MAEERLQKILAQAGIASRRKSEEIILEGRVRVNGQIVTTLGTKADLSRDHIKVDGKLIHKPERMLYLALNKPHEVVTTMSDPQRRKTVADLLRGAKERVYPVGRLDYHSEGLLLFTNDGEFANRVMSKRNNIVKVGQLLQLSDDDLLRMRNFGKKSLDEMKERLRMRGFIVPETESEVAAEGDEVFDDEPGEE